MNNHTFSPEQIEAIGNALQKAIDEGPWEHSNFLKSMGKQLHKIKQDFLEEVGLETDAGGDSNLGRAGLMAADLTHQDVFIALYNSNGDKISVWEKVLANLPRQLVSRPVYAQEKNVKALIQSKSIPQNEAYVIATINKEAINVLSEDKMPRDKLDHPLLTLQDKAVSLDNITCFIHLSESYRYIDGRLVKQDQTQQKR